MGATGILGGTFNPAHNGHVRHAVEVAEALGLETAGGATGQCAITLSQLKMAYDSVPKVEIVSWADGTDEQVAAMVAAACFEDSMRPFYTEEGGRNFAAYIYPEAIARRQSREHLMFVALLDGEIVGDSNPYQEKPDDIIPYEGRKKSYLPLHSAFGLSWKNLLSKAKRTAMICFAASIGIIGVGAVSAVSSGVTGYIDGMQDDLLSCNPVKVAQSAYDLNSIVSMMSSSTQGEIVQDNTVNGIVNVSGVITSIIENAAKSGSFLIENDITEDYLSFVGQMPEEYTEAIHCDYGEEITNNIFTNVKLEKYGDQSMSLSAMLKTYEAMISKVEGISSFSSLVSMVTSMSVFPGDADYLLDQYDLIGQSSFPTSENDLILVVDSNGALSDLTLTQYGYFTQEEFFNRVYQALGSKQVVNNLSVLLFLLHAIGQRVVAYQFINDSLKHYMETLHQQILPLFRCDIHLPGLIEEGKA